MQQVCQFVSLNIYVEPPLVDSMKLIHMIVTNSRFGICYKKQLSVVCVTIAFTWA